MSDNRIVHQPPTRHSCNPGWTVGGVCDDPGSPMHGLEYLKSPSTWSHPPGTVVRCECGKTYVSYKTPSSRGMINVSGVSFRRERGLERWLRTRREGR